MFVKENIKNLVPFAAIEVGECFKTMDWGHSYIKITVPHMAVNLVDGQTRVFCEDDCVYRVLGMVTIENNIDLKSEK